MASSPEAQADTGVWAPARAPISSETAAEDALGMSMGTARGKTRRGPFSRRLSHWSSSVQTPPIPVPMQAARRSGSTSGAPASAQASREAMRAYWALGSSRRTSTLVSTSSGWVWIVAANFTGSSYFSTQSKGMVFAPDRPARMASHVSGTLPPTGVVAPRPVTTTRRSAVMAGSAPSSGWCGDGRALRGERLAASVCRVAATWAGKPLCSVLLLGAERHGVADGLEVLDLVVVDSHGGLRLGVD